MVCEWLAYDKSNCLLLLGIKDNNLRHSQLLHDSTTASWLRQGMVRQMLDEVNTLDR